MLGRIRVAHSSHDYIPFMPYGVLDFLDEIQEVVDIIAIGKVKTEVHEHQSILALLPHVK